MDQPMIISRKLKNVRLLRKLIYLFCFFIIPLTAFAEQRIQSVEVEGNQRVDEATIILQVKSEVGSAFSNGDVTQDIKEIYRTGFFEQVAAKVRKVTGEDVVLIFSVVEKPAIGKVTLVGNEEIRDGDIKEKLNLDARRFLNRAKVRAGVEEAKAFYRSRGYHDVEITVIEEPAGDNITNLKFVVKEGEKLHIREIVFEGNRTQDTSDLEDAVSVSTYSWFTSWITGSGTVKDEQLDFDRQSLTQYYLRNGFVDVVVAEPKMERIEDGLRVVFQIKEGEVFTFNNITASGTLLDDSQEKTLDGIASKSGEVFNVDQLREDSFLISEKFTDIGYAFANVDPVTGINRENKTVDISYQIDKGELIEVSRINIAGNQKTADNVVRRSLAINEQELFSSSKIKKSQELLTRLGYFDEVTITPEPSVNLNEVDLLVSVREGSTGTFSVGAGVSSGDGFIFTTRVSERNLFGTGNSLSLDVDTGSRSENYVISFDNPRVNDSRWSFGANVLAVEREFDDFDRKQKGGSLTLGYPLWFLGEEYLDDIRFSLTYELLKIDIDNVEDDAPQLIKDQEGKTTSSSVTPRLVRNTIDNPVDPTRGSRQSLSAEVAGLGGDQEFWLAQASNTWYYPLIGMGDGTLVFSQRTRFGYGDTFDNEDFPLFRRFFPGGINSVRGYDSRELGPKDQEGNEYGGSKQLVANFELIFPLSSAVGLKGVVFYDAGEAFDDDESIDISELRQAVGWGVRWNSPIAPIRIEIGYPIDREDGEDAVVTNFSFGSPL
ncbi:outer membrane protein assembly factor BamA [bacterium J17]|nr:outer membrane protein assembly factor BamA [bacterium J17]